jgi:hypothetical protein
MRSLYVLDRPARDEGSSLPSQRIKFFKELSRLRAAESLRPPVPEAQAVKTRPASLPSTEE